MAQAPFPRIPQPSPRPTYPNPGQLGQPQIMFSMMQIMMKMMQLMMTQFQPPGGGGQYGNPFQTPVAYGSPQPSPFTYFGGGHPSFYM